MKRIALALLIAATAQASSFRHERVVTPGGGGPNRLDVDVALLSGAQPDLRDLRFFDAQDREVGYLLVAPASTEPQWIDGTMLPIAATKKSSGFEVDLGRRANVDRIKLDGIAAPFLKRATVEGSGDRSRWTLLADATVFDLPDEELRQSEIAFPAGEYRYLRVIWDDRSSAPVQRVGSVTARLHNSATPREAVRFDIAFAKRASEPGKSRYRINLPGARLPIEALEVVVAGGHVYRQAMVTEPRLVTAEVVPTMIGSGTLRRTERDGAVAAEMEVPITTPEGRELDLVIDDTNNPPLAITAIRARLAPQPWIYFESDGGALRARYGNERALRPTYDLEAARPYVATKRIATARWSTTVTPTIADAPRMEIPLGGAINREQFRVSRPLAAAPAGLSLLILDAHVLARTNDLADVRIADAGGRQVPYLVEKRAEPLPVKLAVPERRADGKRSIYRFDLPYEDWPIGTRLVLTTTTRVFDREVTLRRAGECHRNRDTETISVITWRNGDPELLPPPLSFDFMSHDTRAIEVVIDEGDNAPLPLRSAELVLPSFALRFHHPGTPLFLLYESDGLSAPRYDLALLAPRLFGQPAREITLTAAAPAQKPDVDAPQRKLFWIGIAVAAVVLIAMLVRLLRPAPSDAETSRAPSDTTS